MMRILKYGDKQNQEYIIECERCGCEFIYNEQDILDSGVLYSWIFCPQCNEIINTRKGKKYRGIYKIIKEYKF